MAHRFRKRLEKNPAAVTDDEIREMLGEDIDTAKVRTCTGGKLTSHDPNVFPDSNIGDERRRDAAPVEEAEAKLETTEKGKALRKKANRTLNRRLFALGRMLEEVEASIAGVISAPGTTSKSHAGDLGTLREGIEAFRVAVGWSYDMAELPPPIDPKIFDDLLIDPN